jgi:hypothetical protein
MRASCGWTIAQCGQRSSDKLVDKCFGTAAAPDTQDVGLLVIARASRARAEPGFWLSDHPRATAFVKQRLKADP